MLAASAADPIDGLAPAGRLLERTGLPNDIRAELFRGVARWVRPANIPRLENAFREGEGKQRPPTAIRRAAIDACLIYAIWNQTIASPGTDGRKAAVKAPASTRARRIWPETVLNCRIDPDFEVRRAFIRWLGFAHTEEAFDLLKTQSEGTDFELRRTALESLATLHTDEAHAELRSQATKTRDALRAAAVQALAAWGLQDVTPYARDSSAAVRRAVACELGKHATLDSAVVLSELAVDKSTEVQLTAVRAAAGWPDALAFPLLLHAMRDSAAKTRHEAAQCLSSRRKVAGSYRFDSPSEQREAAVIAIASEIGSSLSYLDQVLKREPRAVAEVNELRSAEVRAHLAAFIENPADSPAAAAAREWLAGIGAHDVPLVESYLQGPTRAPPDAIYHDVLPKVSPVYAALVDLQSADVNVRRRGAKTLADRGQAATLSRPVLLRLREILSHEADDLVWRSAMTAVASDSTDECADVANLALAAPLGRGPSAWLRVSGASWAAGARGVAARFDRGSQPKRPTGGDPRLGELRQPGRGPRTEAVEGPPNVAQPAVAADELGPGGAVRGGGQSVPIGRGGGDAGAGAARVIIPIPGSASRPSRRWGYRGRPVLSSIWSLWGGPSRTTRSAERSWRLSTGWSRRRIGRPPLAG